MPRTRIKICGLTRPEDAALAAELAVDYVGLNFVGGPRKIGLEAAQRILEPAFFELSSTKPIPVGLTYSASADRGNVPSAIRIRHYTGIHTFQIYEDEAVRTYHHPETSLDYWYVVHVASRDLAVLKSLATPDQLDGSRIQALVLDTAVKGQLGGTGRTFNWNWIAEARAAGELEGLPPIVLAGGLTPDNVAEAIRIARPYAVDVSSGVEIPGKPGIKDPVRLRAFIDAVCAADAAL